MRYFRQTIITRVRTNFYHWLLRRYRPYTPAEESLIQQGFHRTVGHQIIKEGHCCSNCGHSMSILWFQTGSERTHSCTRCGTLQEDATSLIEMAHFKALASARTHLA